MIVRYWSIHDEGDVQPLWTFAGPGQTLVKPFGMAIDPKNQTVMVSDMKQNAVLSYHVPEIFAAETAPGSRSSHEMDILAVAESSAREWLSSIWSELSN